ncbi:hypothetical protein PGQ11_010212 [Apiospora arundinis]|uniref:Uncharacterized protein n=1 Tax=Apiospora arundinis TaxID=335852 RepID=A0ABR2I919_9PEZI
MALLTGSASEANGSLVAVHPLLSLEFTPSMRKAKTAGIDRSGDKRLRTLYEMVTWSPAQVIY